MTRLLRRTALLVSLTGAFLAASGDALADHFCNDTIGSSGAYVLTHDHTCPAGTAITIQADGVSLDLGGFRVSGAGTGSVGISVSTASDDVVIRNGTVRGFDTGIQAGGIAGGQCFSGSPAGSPDNLTIEDVVVRRSVDFGMWLCSSGNSQVVASRVIDTSGATSAGIHAARGVDIDSTLVRDSADNGIELSAGDVFDDLKVLGTAVEDFGGNGIDIQGLGEGHVEVSDTTISGCTFVSCRGIDADGDVSVLISRATITDVDFGIDAEDNLFHSFRIQDSILRSIGREAIRVENVFLPEVLRTVIRDVGFPVDGVGISFSCTLTGVVRDTLVRNVTGDGIVVDETGSTACSFGSEATLLADNLVVGSSGNGIVLADGPHYQISGNVVRRSGLDGFLVEATATVAVLTGNRAVRNSDDGFQLDTADLTLTGNLAGRNTGYGFETNFDGPVLADNGNRAANNTAGECSDPSDLPNTICADAAPSVTDRSPARDATDVALDSTVTATFSEDVVGVDGSTFTLEDGVAQVAATVTYDSPSRTATLDPNANLAPSTQYTATLTGGIADGDGNALAGTPVVWTFTTEASAGGGIALAGAAISGTTESGTDIVLPSWTPAPNDLVLLSVATRDETNAITVSGNGLTWVEVADVDNVQGQGGIALFRAQGPAPTTGEITVTIAGNASPAVAVAQRFSGVDAATPVEAVATNAGPGVDDEDMLQPVTTQTSGAWAVAVGWYRTETFSLPAGETAILLNQVAGSSGSVTRSSMWYQGPVDPPAATQLGAANDLSGSNDWSMVVVSLRPAP